MRGFTFWPEEFLMEGVVVQPTVDPEVRTRALKTTGTDRAVVLEGIKQEMARELEATRRIKKNPALKISLWQVDSFHGQWGICYKIRYKFTQ